MCVCVCACVLCVCVYANFVYANFNYHTNSRRSFWLFLAVYAFINVYTTFQLAELIPSNGKKTFNAFMFKRLNTRGLCYDGLRLGEGGIEMTFQVWFE